MELWDFTPPSQLELRATLLHQSYGITSLTPLLFQSCRLLLRMLVFGILILLPASMLDFEPPRPTPSYIDRLRTSCPSPSYTARLQSLMYSERDPPLAPPQTYSGSSNAQWQLVESYGNWVSIMIIKSLTFKRLRNVILNNRTLK